MYTSWMINGWFIHGCGMHTSLLGSKFIIFVLKRETFHKIFLMYNFYHAIFQQKYQILQSCSVIKKNKYACNMSNKQNQRS